MVYMWNQLSDKEVDQLVLNIGNCLSVSVNTLYIIV